VEIGYLPSFPAPRLQVYKSVTIWFIRIGILWKKKIEEHITRLFDTLNQETGGLIHWVHFICWLNQSIESTSLKLISEYIVSLLYIKIARSIAARSWLLSAQCQDVWYKFYCGRSARQGTDGIGEVWAGEQEIEGAGSTLSATVTGDGRKNEGFDEASVKTGVDQGRGKSLLLLDSGSGCEREREWVAAA